MTEVAALEAHAGALSEAAAKSTAAAAKQHEYIHGDDNKDVDTESGAVPSIAKQARLGVEKISTVFEEAAVQSGGALPFPSIEIGMLNTPEGGLFTVPAAPDSEYLVLYKKESGQPVELKTSASKQRVDEVEDGALFSVLAAVNGSLDLDYTWSITDEVMKVILGIRKTGVVDAILDRMPGLSHFGDYAWHISDQNETVLLGIKWSGEVVMYPSALASVPAGYAWDEGTIGQRDVFTLIDGVPYQLTSSGDNTSPQVLGVQVHYVERNGTVKTRSVPLPEAGSVAAFVGRIIHVIFLGQSLACGINSGSPVSTQPTAANRLFTLKAGVQLVNEAGVLASNMVAPFTPLMANVSKEPPCLQAAAEINRNRRLPADAGLLISNHGRGAQGIRSLNKGTIPYENSLTAIREAKAECDRKGLPYSVPCISWNQGQHDGGMAEGVYYALLVQLQLDYEADIQAITGQTGRIPMVITQMSNWTAPVYKRAFSYIPHEQYQVSIDYPDRFVVSGPQYWLPSNNDGIHLPANSYSRDGIALSGAIGALINGEKWLPTSCYSAVRKGKVVTLRFNVPHGPLAIDTLNVTDPGNLGIRWIDSTSSVSVTSVELDGYDALRVTLSDEPTGASPMIGIADIGIAGNRAGPDTGPRTCIRDSAPNLDAFGVPVYNWACHQRIAVTSV